MTRESHEVRREAVAELQLTATKSSDGAKRKATDGAIVDDEAANRAAKVHTQSKMRYKTVETCEVDGALSDFFDGLGIAHSKIDSPLAKKCFAAIKNAPRDWKPPSSATLRGNLLDAQFQVDQDERTRALEHVGVQKFGLTVTTDGATIHKSPLLNFILLCVVWPKAFFLKCADCTKHLAGGGAKDAEYVTTLMIASIRALPRPRYLDLIITDGAGDMTKFRRLIVAIFPWLYTIWCVSHIVNCILKKAASDDKLKELIEKGKKIVDRFGGSKHFEHSLFTTKAGGRSLIRYADTRFGLYFVMLHRLLKLRKVLLCVVNCREYADKQFEDDEEYDIINDSNFWEGAEMVVKVVWPLMMLLRLGDTREKPTLPFVYKWTLLAEERLVDFEYDAEAGEYASALLGGLREYKSELCSDLAMAASLVDCSSWSCGTLKDEAECKVKMCEYLSKFAEQYELGEDFLAKAEEELELYLNKEGVFALETVQANARIMSPRRFFDKYAAEIPSFSKAALHLASKCCGSGEAERNWKETKFVCESRRASMKAEKREKLVTRYNTLAMRHGYYAATDVNPLAEMALYGLEDELVDPHREDVGGPGAGANEAVRRNVFKAYQEEGEEDKVSEPETARSTARFELLTKFRGMVLVDEDKDPAEYRRIIDLEWLKKKPKGWLGGRNSWKQWLAVTEPVPEKHRDMLDEADDIKSTYESYVINNELYEMIVAAPRELQPREIEEAPEVDVVDDDDDDDDDDDVDDDVDDDDN